MTIHPTINPTGDAVTVDYEDFKILMGDAPMCEVCGLYVFETSNHKGKQICILCRFREGEKMEPGYKTRPSELELRIRREVMNDLELARGSYSVGQSNEGEDLLLKVRNYLNLLWGE